MRVRQALLILAVAGAAAHAQSAPFSPPLPLTAAERVDVINWVFRARQNIFSHRLLISGCHLTGIIGASTGDRLAGLDPRFRERVKGDSAPNCLTEADIPNDSGIAVIYARDIRHEVDEFIQSPGDAGRPRPSNLIVVRLRMFRPGRQESHTEEWVMRRNAPGVWAMATIRIFAYGVI